MREIKELEMGDLGTMEFMGWEGGIGEKKKIWRNEA